MVNPFNLARIPRILFGHGKSGLLPSLVKSYGKTILLVTGKDSLMNSSIGGRLLNELTLAGICFHHVRVPCEPTPEIIDGCTGLYREEPVDAVVAIGGGSVMDAGKAISAMLRTSGSVRDYLEGVGNRKHPGVKVPFIAMPTTSGTGSEATKNAVISETGKNGFKKSLRHDNFVPEVAIVDPALTLNTPPYITAAGGMDCFTQLTEAFLSDKSGEYTDALALEGLKAVHRSLIPCYTCGEDIAARSDMSFAALTSGICLANAGLGAVHGLASTIGGMFPIPHGLLCGTLMAAANELNVRKLRETEETSGALRKYALLGRIFLEEEDKPDDFLIDGFITLLEELTEGLNLPRLREYGITEKNAYVICSKTDIKNNPVKLTSEELAGMVCRRL